MQNLLSRRLSLALGLPTLALASLLGAITPGFAAAQDTNQAVADSSEPVMVANLSNIFRDVNRGVQEVQRDTQRQQREQERRLRTEQRRQQAEQRRQQAEERRQRIAEQNRLEAERRRQYFESLSPEQQQAFLEEQRARRAQAEEAATIFLIQVLTESLRTGGPSSGNSSMGDEVDICLRHRIAACRNLD